MQLKGKPLTLGAKLAGCLMVLIGLLLIALDLAGALTMDDILKAAAFLVFVFAPIDVSLWIETWRGSK